MTLPSNACDQLYPRNDISIYRMKLAKTIHLKGNWEVGVAEINFPWAWYTLANGQKQDIEFWVCEGSDFTQQTSYK